MGSCPSQVTRQTIIKMVQTASLIIIIVILFDQRTIDAGKLSDTYARILQLCLDGFNI